MSPESSPVRWLERTDWLWTLVGGFYLLAYLFWFVPALAGLPRSLWDPPEQFPWHWPLDFVVTGAAGTVLVFLGFRRATELSDGPGGGSGHRTRGDRAGRAGQGEPEERRSDEAGVESRS